MKNVICLHMIAKALSLYPYLSLDWAIDIFFFVDVYLRCSRFAFKVRKHIGSIWVFILSYALAQPKEENAPVAPTLSKVSLLCLLP